MGGGSFIDNNGGKGYPGKMTKFVQISCIIAASSCFIHGYEIGVSGGITIMDAFLKTVLPSIFNKMHEDSSNHNQYCRFNNQPKLTLFTSFYFLGFILSLVASKVFRAIGKKPLIIIGEIIIFGSTINTDDDNLWNLIIGRMLLGIGIGLITQDMPMYVSMTPSNLRGAMNIGYQLMITSGIFVSNLVNYTNYKITGGCRWRASLVLADTLAIIMCSLALYLPDTPYFLLEQGREGEAFAMLKKIRGVEDVREEFEDIKKTSKASQVKHPWWNIVKRKYRPQLCMSILIPIFQKLTGIEVVIIYAPVLFTTLGFRSDISLMNATITAGIHIAASWASIIIPLRKCRGSFLRGVQVVIFTCVAIKLGFTGVTSTSKDMVILIVIYTAFYALACDPLERPSFPCYASQGYSSLSCLLLPSLSCPCSSTSLFLI